jgi:hypothetical protein
VKILTRPDFGRHYRLCQTLSAGVVALSLLAGGAASSVAALPVQDTVTASLYAQNVDWMSWETAASLDIGIDVLVPSWIPEPFSGVSPSITASNGYYQLYWMIPGGSPTFLYIEGVAGGTLPAGSPADLNKQLSINTTVQGWDAIQDTGIPAGGSTPIYDQVWWIANGVLYTVSSNNMTGSDSLLLANSLVVLELPEPSAPPEAPAEPPTEPPYVPPVESEPVAEVSAPDDPVAMDEVSTEQVSSEELVDEQAQPTGNTNESASKEEETVSEQDVAAALTDELSTANSVDVGGTSETQVMTGETSAPQGPWSPSRYDGAVPSDGTNGPLPPLIGGDGTGGLYDTALPSIRIRP